MKEKQEYKIEKARAHWPKRGGGRKKAVNNDDQLVARALYGLEKGTYKSYRHAAIQLAPKARTLVERQTKKTGGLEHIVDRLRHKISEAYKDSDPTTPVRIRLHLLRKGS